MVRAFSVLQKLPCPQGRQLLAFAMLSFDVLFSGRNLFGTDQNKLNKKLSVDGLELLWTVLDSEQKKVSLGLVL